MRAIVMLLAALAPLTSLSASQEKAERFVVLMKYNEQYGEFRSNCLKTSRAVPASKLMEDGGLKPASKYWPEVEAAYEQYFVEVCARPTEREFLSAMAKAYASKLSDAELDGALRFYSSTAGQHLVAAHQEAAKNVYSEWGRINAEYVPAASGRLNRAIQAARKKSGR